MAVLVCSLPILSYSDCKGEPYVHQMRGADNLIGPPFEILSDKAVSTATASGSSGNAGGKPVRNPEREKPKWEKPKWEDTITNRMLHWSYTTEQKEELKKALAAGVPKATILAYFYPEVTVEKMSSYRMKQ